MTFFVFATASGFWRLTFANITMRKRLNAELQRLQPADYSQAERPTIWVILENLRSAHNVGSLFRTCDAFGMSGISLCGYCARPPHKQVDKVALGAQLSLPWDGHEDALSAIQAAKDKGLLVLAVEQADEAIQLQDLPCPQGGIALVFGNEVDGVSEMAMAACDGAVEIPQFGTKHSLNVSVCGGAVLWEVARRYRKL